MSTAVPPLACLQAPPSADAPALPPGPGQAAWNASPALRTVLRMAHASPMPMLAWWGPEHLQFSNAAWARLWGAQDAEAPQGQPGPTGWGAAWHGLAEDIAQVLRTGSAVWRDNTPLPAPAAVQASDLFATYSFNPIAGDAGTEGVLLICSRFYRANAVQADGRFGYAAVIHSLDVGFAIVEVLPQANTPDLRFLEVNLALEQQTGLRNAVGKCMSELLPAQGHDWARLCARVVATGEPVRLERQLAGMGRVFDLFAMRLGGPGSAQVALLFKDITAAKQAEAALQRSEQALKEAHQRKDEFLAMLAHELRNPLAPIGAAAELMGRADADRELLHTTSAIIARQVRHMTGLVDDLLDTSRVSRGLIRLERQVLDANALAREAVEQALPLLQARGHALALELAPQAACVDGDRKRLVQVLSNLLSNAAKYTPDGGRIALQVQADAGQVQWRVSDNGLGMDADTLRCAFELFAQARRSADREQGGLGIGLALVRQLVALHGGQVSGHSDGLGQGSEFVVRLPQVAAPVEGACEPHTPATHAATARLRVLVVDDHEDAATTLAMLIDACGHDCQVCHRPQQALALAAQWRPDVCVLDIGLPGMDGRELARRLHGQPGSRQATLVALTGYAGEHDRQLALAAGFAHYFVKPVDTHRLTELLAALASSRQALTRP